MLQYWRPASVHGYSSIHSKRQHDSRMQKSFSTSRSIPVSAIAGLQPGNSGINPIHSGGGSRNIASWVNTQPRRSGNSAKGGDNEFMLACERGSSEIVARMEHSGILEGRTSSRVPTPRTRTRAIQEIPGRHQLTPVSMRRFSLRIRRVPARTAPDRGSRD